MNESEIRRLYKYHMHSHSHSDLPQNTDNNNNKQCIKNKNAVLKNVKILFDSLIADERIVVFPQWASSMSVFNGPIRTKIYTFIICSNKIPLFLSERENIALESRIEISYLLVLLKSRDLVANLHCSRTHFNRFFDRKNEKNRPKNQNLISTRIENEMHKQCERLTSRPFSILWEHESFSIGSN